MTGQLLPKVYVSVATTFCSDGTLLPTTILWENGRQFPIDQVLGLRQAVAMRSGGIGDKYKIKVSGKERYLYFEHDSDLKKVGRWFVAGKQ